MAGLMGGDYIRSGSHRFGMLTELDLSKTQADKEALTQLEQLKKAYEKFEGGYYGGSVTPVNVARGDVVTGTYAWGGVNTVNVYGIDGLIDYSNHKIRANEDIATHVPGDPKDCWCTSAHPMTDARRGPK